MKISVIGCGYLGAVHASALAELGHDVVGIDLDAAKVSLLAEGRAPFFEPGLPEVLVSTLSPLLSAPGDCGSARTSRTCRAGRCAPLPSAHPISPAVTPRI